MARLVDCYSTPSNDELPQPDELQWPGTDMSSCSKDCSATATGKTSLLSKSTSTSSTRKVRRLYGGLQAAANPLLLPWNADDGDSSRTFLPVSPKKTPMPSGKVSQQAENDDQRFASQSDKAWAPSRAVRQSRARRQRAVSPCNHEPDEKNIESVATLQADTRQSRIAGSESCHKLGGSAVNRDNETERMRERAPGRIFTHTSSDIEGSSVYQTAAEDTSDYSDGSASEFEPGDLSDSCDEAPSAKQPLGLSRQHRSTTSKTPRQEPFHEALIPRNANMRVPQTVRDSTLSDEASRAPDRGRRLPAQDPLRNVEHLSNASELVDSLEKLQIQLHGFENEENRLVEKDDFVTPPNTPPRKPLPKSLVSPRKPARIPQTPHRPSVDAFWGKGFVDDWNDRHSPRKPLLRPPTEAPAKSSPDKAIKKSFDAKKHSLAEEFLGELDAQITQGRIAELAQSTGGVKLVWTKALNTTAGRANWRRETTRSKLADGTMVGESHRHHASIELAEKVVDDEDKLVSVLAHEFCHLANFMISGVTNKPHGKEFKSWAAKCTRAFGASRGIRVTTKHTYEIDFKYVWECTACRSEYKRHSKSIDPQRHRCGSCKSALRQTKPVPRGGTAAGRGRPSEYQAFVKEQMKIVKGENPGSPQKVVMRIVADKWAKAKETRVATSKAGSREEADDVASQMAHLTLEGGDKGEQEAVAIDL